MTYSPVIAEAVFAHLQWRGCSYCFDEQAGVFSFALGVCEERLKRAEVSIEVGEDSLVLYGAYPVRAAAGDGRMMARLAEYVCRVNGEIPGNACFEFCAASGEVRFRVFAGGDDGIPTASAVRDCVCMADAACTYYAHGFARVLLDGVSARAALESVYRRWRGRAEALPDMEEVRYSQPLAEGVASAMGDDAVFTFDRQRGVFLLGTKLNVPRMPFLPLRIHMEPNGYTVRAAFREEAMERKSRTEMAFLANSVNRSVPMGCFEAGMDDGTLCFRRSFHGEDSWREVRRNIAGVRRVADFYAEAITQIVFDGETAVNAIHRTCEHWLKRFGPRIDNE